VIVSGEKTILPEFGIDTNGVAVSVDDSDIPGRRTDCTLKLIFGVRDNTNLKLNGDRKLGLVVLATVVLPLS
jgi:hypothetical protein